VVAESQQGGEDFEYDRGVDEVDLLPEGVRNPVRAGGRGGGGLGKSEFDFLGCERGGAEGFLWRWPLVGRGSLGGKKWSSSALLIATGPEAFEVPKLGLSRDGVGVGVWSFLALWVAFVNSFRRGLRSRVHQALDLGDGREWGAVACIVAVSADRTKENHWSSWLGEGASGGGVTCQSLSLSVRLGQSTSCQRGLSLSLWGEAGRVEITISAWSDPVQGRVDESYERKAEKISGFAKARSMVLGL